MNIKHFIVVLLIAALLIFQYTYAANEVSLREYLEQRLDLQDRALALQAKEIERRLEGLNELRTEVVKDRSLFLNKDVAEAEWKNFHSWQLTVNDRLTAIETRSVVWTTAIGIFFAILQIVLFIWSRKRRFNGDKDRE